MQIKVAKGTQIALPCHSLPKLVYSPGVCESGVYGRGIEFTTKPSDDSQECKPGMLTM
jgi:hypothetical protein